MAVPSDKNIFVKEFDKLSKYKDLQIEITKMWHLKTTIIHVVIGALGLKKKGADNYLSQIPGTPTLAEIQKITLMGTARILRKTTQTISTGANDSIEINIIY